MYGPQTVICEGCTKSFDVDIISENFELDMVFTGVTQITCPHCSKIQDMSVSEGIINKNYNEMLNKFADNTWNIGLVDNNTNQYLNINVTGTDATYYNTVILDNEVVGFYGWNDAGNTGPVILNVNNTTCT